MNKYAVRLAALAAVVPVSLALSAAPSSAQVAIVGEVTVTGVATCNVATGHETWTVDWTITNTYEEDSPNGTVTKAPALVTPLDVSVDHADESGIVTADVLAGVSPNPIPGASAATVSDGPIPNQVGDITLDVDGFVLLPDNFYSASGTVHLDGSCVIPVTAAPTTAPPAARSAVEARPAFTG